MLKSMSKPKRLWMGAGFIMAVVSFTLWGYFWYAVLLDDIWQTLIARSEEELLGLAAARGFMQTVMSYLGKLSTVCRHAGFALGAGFSSFHARLCGHGNCVFHL